MKKLLAIALTMLTIVTPKTACAAEKTGYVYTIINNQATVTGFQGEPVYIEIPETVEGCRVVEIRDNAFYNCSSLKHITIPETVTKIGHHTFYGCTSLESISIPDSVTEVGMGCFCGCSGLKSATVSEGLERLPESCFRSCTLLKAITLPQSITGIGDFCFSGCTSLSAVSLGDRIRTIGDCAFYMCGALDGIFIPASAEQIGVCAVGYMPTNDGAQPIEDFTVLGERKSAADLYAGENHLTFENAADSVHAFAVRQISGRRVAVPTPYLAASAAGLFALPLILTRRKKRRGT